MEYFFKKIDSNGFIHSIDNVVLTYYVESIGLKSIDTLIGCIHLLRDKYKDSVNYYEKLNVTACSKYSFYQNVIHLDDGIFLMIGHYGDYDKEKKEMYIFPLMQLEINPNKHFGKEVFNDLMDIINDSCYDCSLKRYDYAIDVPYNTDDVIVFNSRKEKGLCKGTRYFGQRNRNGYCRIYDKAKEQGLDITLTRIEHVVNLIKGTKELSFEKVYLNDTSAVLDMSDLGVTDKCLVELCQRCIASGVEYEDLISTLNYRKRVKILEYINGNGYKMLEYDIALHDELVNEVKGYFDIKEKEWIDADEKTLEIFGGLD